MLQKIVGVGARSGRMPEIKTSKQAVNLSLSGPDDFVKSRMFSGRLTARIKFGSLQDPDTEAKKALMGQRFPEIAALAPEEFMAHPVFQPLFEIASSHSQARHHKPITPLDFARQVIEASNFVLPSIRDKSSEGYGFF